MSIGSILQSNFYGSGVELRQELLAIFGAFKKWPHYLESPLHMIDVIADHKDLEHFMSTEVPTYRQARWLEYVSVFNHVVRFCPQNLGEKPDSLTRRVR